MSKQDDGVETKTTPNSPENSKESEAVKSPAEETKDEELSRRQKLAKEREELEQRTREYEERLKRLESQVQQQEESKIISSILSDLNIESYDKEVYEEVKSKLSSLPLNEAVEMALLKASKSQTKESQEEKQREEMRKDASMPPAGQPMQESQGEFALLSKADYSKLVATRGTDYFKKYNAHWEAKGRGEKPYID